MWRRGTKWWQEGVKVWRGNARMQQRDAEGIWWGVNRQRRSVKLNGEQLSSNGQALKVDWYASMGIGTDRQNVLFVIKITNMMNTNVLNNVLGLQARMVLNIKNNYAID